ncbi:MAG: sulfatase [Haliscomenobacter sp.]|uniref:sulfatase n=1 Tax=Haliscomenobacter sp. TaxID=2717303 RepID=UPI0029B530C4|nr:sulfatase [Haliscomenobacter sp.]MDX2069132.1 sulfatase [Haliscomenobacter sp.]
MTKQALCALTLFCLFLQQDFVRQKAPLQQPNIILFLVDDMGWMDTSLPFGETVMPLNKKYFTPNMQRLADEGMVFTNAYVNPVCTPTRTSLISGLSAIRTHITNWTNTPKDSPTDYPDSLLQFPDWNVNGLSPTNTGKTYTAKPLPQLLRDAGYITLHVGKAHWGSQSTPGSDPINLGFMSNIGGTAIGHPQSYYGLKNFGNEPGKMTHWAIPSLQEFYGQDIFLTEALTRKALQLMAAPIQQKRPFFLYLGHYAVHTPIMPDHRYFNKYLRNGLDSIEAAYATLVEGMDKSLGDVMDFLKSKNADKNTVIVFMSDNGGLSNSNRGGIRHTHNLPLRSGKGSVYEGGIRIPMIVKWPGTTKPGSRTAQYVMAEDFFPTVLDMASIQNKALRDTIDGKSYLSVLKKPALQDTSRSLVFHYPHRWTTREAEAIAWASAIRKGNWKLVYLFKQKKLELYNLAEDLGEKHDLSKKYPAQTARMAKLLATELRKRNAQIPVWKSTGQPVAWPDEL